LEAALDSDRDGYITAEELTGATAALQKLDVNGDGTLSADEYRPQRPGGGSGQGSQGNGLSGSDRHGRTPPVSPLELALDADKDGVITAAEMTNAAATVKALDTNGDGKVSREESQPPRPGDQGGSGRGQGQGQGSGQGQGPGSFGGDPGDASDGGSGSGMDQNPPAE